jgi:hypothetical protein
LRGFQSGNSALIDPPLILPFSPYREEGTTPGRDAVSDMLRVHNK